MVTEGERVTFQAARFFGTLGAMTLRVYPEAVGGLPAATVSLEHQGGGSWAWTASGESGIAHVTEAYPADPTIPRPAYEWTYAARLVVIALPRSTLAECARWTKAAATAHGRGRTAYRLAKTTPDAATRKSAYQAVRRHLTSRGGYLRLLADGRCTTSAGSNPVAPAARAPASPNVSSFGVPSPVCRGITPSGHLAAGGVGQLATFVRRGPHAGASRRPRARLRVSVPTAGARAGRRWTSVGGPSETIG